MPDHFFVFMYLRLQLGLFKSITRYNCNHSYGVVVISRDIIPIFKVYVWPYAHIWPSFLTWFTLFFLHQVASPPFSPTPPSPLRGLVVGVTRTWRLQCSRARLLRRSPVGTIDDVAGGWAEPSWDGAGGWMGKSWGTMMRKMMGEWQDGLFQWCERWFINVYNPI